MNRWPPQGGYKLTLLHHVRGHDQLMSGGTGIPLFLKSQGIGGWPDLQVGGPGFCFPVLRWNGQKYDLHHYEYEGKRCKP